MANSFSINAKLGKYYLPSFNSMNKRMYLKNIKNLDIILQNELKRIELEKQDVIKNINIIKENLNKEYNAIQKQRSKKSVST